jgi:hypothetical protein
MAVENVTYIDSLDPTAPAGGDSISEGDDHIRNIKRAIKDTFPNVDGPVDLSTAEFGALKSSLSNGGVVASCKYNGASIMYQEGIDSVNDLGGGGYRVNFSSGISGFDNHYAPIITPFWSVPGFRPTLVSLTGFTADYVEFIITQINADGSNEGAIGNGFSLLVVDLITNS